MHSTSEVTRRSRIATLALAAALLATVNTSTQAQTTPTWKPGWEFVAPTGALVPTGDQRDAIKRGAVSAAQISYVAHPMFAVTGTFGWARSRGIAYASNPKLDVLMYDLGVELRVPRLLTAGKVSFSPFTAAGAGARSYSYRGPELSTYETAAYAGAGAEVGLGWLHLRVEARDYLTGFARRGADTRNDVVLMAGLRIGR